MGRAPLLDAQMRASHACGPPGRCRAPAWVAQAASQAAAPARAHEARHAAKERLWAAISTTNRGGRASSSQRGAIEEAQVALEALSESLDYSLLAGRWRVVYSSAPDVAPLFSLDGLPLPLRVGGVFQQFSSLEAGEVLNIIQLSVPFLLEPGEGVTLTVRAAYEVRSPRRIALTFQEAQVGDVRISSQLEALAAPALLPRGWLNHRLLLAIREFRLRVPLQGQLPTALQDRARGITRNVGAEYLLTYLDGDTLIGRQTGPGGTFIFQRAD